MVRYLGERRGQGCMKYNSYFTLTFIKTVSIQSKQWYWMKLESMGGGSDVWQRIAADIGYFILGQNVFYWIKTFKTLTVSR